MDYRSGARRRRARRPRRRHRDARAGGAQRALLHGQVSGTRAEPESFHQQWRRAESGFETQVAEMNIAMCSPRRGPRIAIIFVWLAAAGLPLLARTQRKAQEKTPAQSSSQPKEDPLAPLP